MGSRVGAMIAGMKSKGKRKGMPKLEEMGGLKDIKVKGFKPIGGSKKIKVPK